MLDVVEFLSNSIIVHTQQCSHIITVFVQFISNCIHTQYNNNVKSIDEQLITKFITNPSGGHMLNL